MSRLIVKNLPNKVSVDSLRDLFGQKGEVTDVQLKYTKDGKFRNFGFIGFRSEDQAAAARDYFDGTCIRSMKIDVQVCANLGDDKKPRAWSKYAPDSTAYQKIHKDENEDNKKSQSKVKKVAKNKNKIIEILKKHKNDPLFAEFIEAHSTDKTSWIKEAFEKAAKSDDDDEDNDDDTQNNVDVTNKQDIETTAVVEDKSKKTDKTANKKISDLEYMKSLMKKVGGTDQETVADNVEEQPKKIRNRPLLYVKITGLPYKCKKKDVKDFFRPLVPYSIRLPLGKGKKLAGFCYVGFRTEPELKKALNKDKLFLGNHRVHVNKYEDKTKINAEEEEETYKKKVQEKNNNGESIGESGSIFVRNLPYIVSEQELTTLFEKYGPITEMNMPIDPILRQPKGFATVTFMMPEHAVQAYSELDGTAFCGRMLHILPAKTEKLQDSDDEGLTFKEKKAKKLKAQAKSSHNWNTLFLGTNAVADVIATNYNTTKEQLLTENSNATSAAVRLALGETQLVSQTRKFLEDHGVYLEAFSSATQKRSKTCILIKNLPAGTQKDEIKSIFEKFGPFSRFVMPEHGITALVDFIEPFEAKKAFTKLAYSQFKSAPLYLEWAPENIFKKDAPTEKVDAEVSNSNIEKVDSNNLNLGDSNKNQSIKEQDKKPEIIDEEPENDTTLFVKNINFRTTEEALLNHFSSCGRIHNATIAKKRDPKNPGNVLSMGYGFVQFYTKRDTNEALKHLQSSTLDGKTVELKRSERGNSNEVKISKKSSKETVQNGTKILARNVPFQANQKELHEIFRAFGEIKSLRLPKKLTPGAEQHRGFAFVDYLSKADAKSAFDALCHSTHLYGRRLVLEWADQNDDTEDVNALRKRTAQSFNSKTPGGKKSKKAEVDAESFVDGL